MRRNIFPIFFIFLFIVMITQIFAFGRKEEDEIKTQNDEWILCITSFDISSLSPARAGISAVVAREIVQYLDAISYRTRISEEYTYYEEFAWARARSTAAKAIATKMEERSAELYRGNPRWRYRQNIKKIDDDLIKLRENLEEIEANAPIINKEPVFKLTRENLQLTFPPAPAPGTENRFCTTQRADAFLSGSIRDFHGRYFLRLNLFTVYTQSFVWEDSIIFSQDDMENAIDEIMQKLIINLAGNQPAFLAVTAEPEDTLILIDRSFAGRGGIDLMELPPSTISITASAPNHESITFETELSADVQTNITINLKPIEYSNVNITGETGGRLYQGALYVGNAPLTLRLPAYHSEYFELDTRNSRKGTTVFITPEPSDLLPSVSMKTKPVLPRGQVSKDRRHYYWAWGATWIAGITYWISNYSFNEANNVIETVYNNNPAFIDNYYTMYYVSQGALVVLGTAFTYSLYRFIRYLHTANRESVPISRTDRKEESK